MAVWAPLPVPGSVPLPWPVLVPVSVAVPVSVGLVVSVGEHKGICPWTAWSWRYTQSGQTYRLATATLDGAGPSSLVRPRKWLGLTESGYSLVELEPIDGEDACHANGGTIGFKAENPEQVAAWHAAGLEAGGTTCEDPPGERVSEMGSMHLAYLRDPSGNKICAAFRSG